LKAGMVLLTGSIVASIPLNPGDEVRISFTHLGELALKLCRIAAAGANRKLAARRGGGYIWG
ncbi:MAG: hypothetical protein V3S29_14810, partial [bacterium]